MRHPILSIFLCASLLVTATPRVDATTVCATSVAQVNVAIAQAAGDSSGMTIQIAAGNYTLPAVGFDNASLPALHNLVIQGGYNNDCSAHSNGAATTVFTGSAGAGLRLKAIGDLRLSDISFVGLQGHSELTLLGSESDDLIVERASFRDSVSTALQLQSADGESGRISMQNVLVFGASNSSGCVVMVTGNSGKALVANNTIVDSTASMGLCLSGQMEKQAYANVAWNVSGTDFANTGSNVLSVRNLYGEISGSLDPASNGDISSDPAFVNPAAADFDLAPGSPAINSGGTFLPGGLANLDLQGSSRVKGSQVDRGALESAVSDLAVFTVSNAGDGVSEEGDPGTLRRAISDANAAGQAALIEFAIPGGCGIHQILINRTLPLVAVPMIIDGTTQPGSSENTSANAFNAQICVVIAPDPAASPPASLGLLVLSTVDTSVTVRGLGFSGFFRPLIFTSGSGHRVLGNQFGGTLSLGATQLPLQPNTNSIYITNGSSDTLIGGPDRVDRNVIAGATGFTGTGLLLNSGSSHAVEVRNNLIGIDRDGLLAAPLGQGVAASGSGHIIVDNKIGGCSTTGIRLATADHVTVQNNDIGGLLPNGVGIILSGSSLNTIGAAGADTGRGNRITNNVSGAVWIDSTSGIFNRVRDNQLTVVESPLGEDAMVLDLGEQGSDPNDPGDGDNGPNNRLNYPELTNPIHAGDTLSFTANLDVPIGDYTLDVYTADRCLSNGRAMADRKLLTLNVAKSQMGAVIVPVALPASALNPIVLGATLTDSGGNTSELSNCLDVDRIFANDFESH